jgi:hypothetical protein
MVAHRELGVDRAVLLHAVPMENHSLRATLTPPLAALGATVGAVWQRLLPGPVVRYARVDNTALMDRCPAVAERYCTTRDGTIAS